MSGFQFLTMFLVVIQKLCANFGGGGGCLGGFRDLTMFLVVLLQLCVGFEGEAMVFWWFSGLNDVFGHAPTIASW